MRRVIINYCEIFCSYYNIMYIIISQTYLKICVKYIFSNFHITLFSHIRFVQVLQFWSKCEKYNKPLNMTSRHIIVNLLKIVKNNVRNELVKFSN